MKEFFLKTKDGIKLALNHYDTGHKEVLIIVHGWFMTKDSRAFSDMSQNFSKEFDVIAFDCRGHGKSSGFYTFTSKETIDLKTVVDFAKTKYKKVYLAGFSLGGALVLIHSALYKDIDKIIAVSAPVDFDKIENQMWKKEAFIPTFKKDIEAPTLFIAGKKDVTVCSWHTEKLYKEAVCYKKFELFDSIHAEDLYLDEPQRFINICVQFLRA